jgi:hypothetical protein
LTQPVSAASRLLVATQSIAVTLWVGALWTSGLLVAPVLFNVLEDRALAGLIAGRVFNVTALVGFVCGVVVLVSCCWQLRRRAFRHMVPWLVLLMLLCAVVGQYGIQPVLAGLREQAAPAPVMQSPFGASFMLWHRVAEALYLLQCLLGVALVARYRNPAPD